MKVRRVTVLLGALALGMTLTSASPLHADDTSMLNDDDRQLLEIEDDVVDLQSDLSAARWRGDDPEKVEELQKKFNELQKKRLELLRRTWRM